MRSLPAILLLTTGVVGAGAAREPEPATDFDKLHALIRPQAAEEAWRQIPWRTDLWSARREAAKLGKPILLWEMDGHPLGCT